MTVEQAMTKAMQYFETVRPGALITGVRLRECSNNWRTNFLSLALIHIEYLVGNDHTESIEHPFYIYVKDKNGKAFICENGGVL